MLTYHLEVRFKRHHNLCQQLSVTKDSLPSKRLAHLPELRCKVADHLR